MKDTVPIERKFGYDHMIEMNAIRKQLREEDNITDYATLHFMAVERYTQAHKNDPTYRETSARLAAQSRTIQHGTHQQLLEFALRQIAEGHNDAMGLARQVLGIKE